MALIQKSQNRNVLQLVENIIVKRKIHRTLACPILNQFGVDLLPDSFNHLLFDKIKPNKVSSDVIKSSKAELDKFGLGSTDSSNEVTLPDVSRLLPPLRGSNVLEHFRNIATEQIIPYLNLLKPLITLVPPALPTKLRLEAGWVRYGFDGTVTNVPYPLEHSYVFDVEVSVLTDKRSVMASCVSEQAWYTWISPYLLSAQPFPEAMTPDTMIPLGSSPDQPKLVIGHNVSYDRVRVGDEYDLDLSGTRYLDTMSLHIAYSGMTSSQRMVKMGEKKVEPSARPKWLERTCMNNLAACHEHYCKPKNKLDKDVRNAFVKCSLAEIRDDLPNLLDYCLKDVLATLQVVQELVPKFLANCKHPASLSGMFTMSTAFLPTNQAWNKYIESSDAEYDKVEGEMQLLLEKEVWEALALYKNEEYKKDPWLWDLDWKPGPRRGTKKPLLLELAQKLGKEETEFPTWFHALINKDEQGEPYLDISTSKRFVPKVLRLTWKGYPIHFDKEHKWGYLVPSDDIKEIIDQINMGEIETDFPLAEFLDSISQDKTDGFKQSTDIFVDEVVDFSGFVSKANVEPDLPNPKDAKPIDIPGVSFYKLPHKNGPTHNVGNPLSKDFLSACSEGGALASKIKNLARELLGMNSTMVYWRNARARIAEQVKVDQPIKGYSAIVPSLVVCGTVTRRAVEKTWLTASNAKATRIGSELKTAIRCPPGYHFVGADVDSQELWLASVLGDSERGGHGATALGWMSLQGEKSKGTDLHSKTAAAAQVTRDQAKVLNYARIYGAGEPFARQLLKQFNPGLTDNEVAARAKHMYEQTKGLRGYKLNEKGKWLYEFIMPDVNYEGEMISKKTMNMLTKKMVFLNRIVKESKYVNHKDKIIHCHILSDDGKNLYEAYSNQRVQEKKNLILDDNSLKEFHGYLEETFGDYSRAEYDVMNTLVHQTIWFGGSESHTFNRLEHIAMLNYPKTPVLGVNISRALETRLIGRNFLPSRINWVVQSTAVDFLHLLLVSMQWLMQELGIKGRFCISIHDEVRYLVASEDRYKAALAMHFSNLLVRSHVVASLGLSTLPAAIAYFSSVDIDTVLRKEPNSDCVTPSNPLGLAKGHGVPYGEGLDIFQTIDKLTQESTEEKGDQKNEDKST